MAENLGANFSIDIARLRAGLNEANQLIRESQSEFKSAAAGMDDWTKSEEGLTAKLKSLNSTADIQKEKVNALKQNYEQLINDGLDPASNEASKLRTQINNEEAALAKTEKEIDDNIEALENLGKETDDSGGKMEKFGEILKGVGKVAGAAFGAATAGLAALTKQAVEGYADYEQLVGGVETLFGTGGQSLEEYAKSVGKSVDEAKKEYDKLKSAEETMIKNANDAYKTAGMSANEYMENVTAFSASLIGSLDGDTQKAADAANRAMIDMSDNANKMGTDMDTIVQTYQSLSKGNFQMLDNLKLGYGGTKTEMERMIADANKIKKANGEMADLSIDSFADMTEAIHIIQTEMGISGISAEEAAEAVKNGTMTQEEALAAMGTTAKEASTTIQGSASAMKAAWGNLVTGMADENADIDQLIENLIDSVGTFLDNLLPRIVTATEGIIKVIEKLVPMIPPLIEKFLPVVIDGIMNLLDGVVAVLPTVIDTILQVVPDLIAKLIEMLPTLIQCSIDIIVQVINAISGMIPVIVDAVMAVLPVLVHALVNAVPELLNAAITLLMALIEAIPTIVTELTKALPEIISTIISVLINNLPMLIKASIQLYTALIKAIPKVLPAIIKAIPQIISAIFDALTSPEAIESIKTAGKDLIKGLWEGIKDMAGWIGEKIEGFGESVLNSLQNFFGISSPSKLMRDMVGKNLALGIGEGFTKNIGKVNDEIIDAMNFDDPHFNVSATYSGSGGKGYSSGKQIVVNQYNTYSQAHSRYEIYKSKQQTAAAVRLAMSGA